MLERTAVTPAEDVKYGELASVADAGVREPYAMAAVRMRERHDPDDEI